MQKLRRGRQEWHSLHTGHWTTATWLNLFFVSTFQKLMLKYLTEFKEANQNDLMPVYKTWLGVRDLQEDLSHLRVRWLSLCQLLQSHFASTGEKQALSEGNS